MNNQAGEPANNIRQHREAAGYTQADVAERIQVDSNSVSRWELGRVTPYLSQQRRLADVLGVTVAELGIKGRAPAETATPSPYAFLQEPEIEAVDRRISDSQNQWLQTRRALNVHRAALTEAAVRVYPPDVRVLDTTLLAPASWIPDQPVDLDNVELVLDEHATEPAVDGTEPETAHVRPLADIVRPYARYTQAIRDIAKPRLLDNRLSWRALGVDATGGQIRLKFGETTYFGTMDTHEALAHEAAYVHLTADGRPSGRPSALRALPFRRLIGDPFDLDHRPCITSISTLTVRGGTKPSFLLHRRDAQSVAVAGGMIHVAPSGVFQPSSILPAAKNADFNLWRNISREFSEELFGNDDADGNGHAADYTAEPFATLDRARADRRLTVSYVGAGLDALTLACEVLTVAVFEPDLYDELAAEFVTSNEEGTFVTEHVAFDEVTVKGVLGSGRMAPAAAGLLALAWKHRATLLG